MNEIYRILRGNTPTVVNYSDFADTAFVSKVAEYPAPYGEKKKD